MWKLPMVDDHRKPTHGRRGLPRVAMLCAGYSVGDWVAGSARTPRWRHHRAAIPSCSEPGAPVRRGDAAERFGHEPLDSIEVAVGVHVSRADVVRDWINPQLLRLTG